MMVTNTTPNSSSATPLRIMHTESSLGWGGQEIRILTESAGMIARGHEVTLVCPAEAEICKQAERFGVRAVVPLPIARKKWSGMKALRRCFMEHEPDVVNTHSSTDSWLTELACRSIRHAPPTVRTRHISSHIPGNIASRWIYSRAPRHVVTTGEALRATLIAELGVQPDRVTSIPTGIDTARYVPGDKKAAQAELGLDPSCHYLGIVATLRSWKGHRYLVDAFARLDAPDWHLLIVGGGPQWDNLSAQIAEMGLGGRVSLVGQQHNVERWLQSLDMFCLSSFANEGVPQSIMQAMLTGLPIVTTPVGAILEAVVDRETALIVPPEDDTALAAGIDELIRSPALREQLGKQSREQASRRFSLDTMLKRMEEVFVHAKQAA